MLRIQNHKKMDETPSEILPLIVTATLINHSVSRFLIDDGSLCDQIYLIIFMKSGLRMKDLKPCEGKSLIAFNDSSTWPCGETNLPVSFVEGKNKIIVNMFFLMFTCEKRLHLLSQEITHGKHWTL